MSVQSLANKIAQAINKSKSKSNAVKTGIVEGNSISVDGRNYPYEVAVDVDVGDGDTVFVMFADGGGRVVVVGR